MRLLKELKEEFPQQTATGPTATGPTATGPTATGLRLDPVAHRPAGEPGTSGRGGVAGRIVAPLGSRRHPG